MGSRGSSCGRLTFNTLYGSFLVEACKGTRGQSYSVRLSIPSTGRSWLKLRAGYLERYPARSTFNTLYGSFLVEAKQAQLATLPRVRLSIPSTGRSWLKRSRCVRLRVSHSTFNTLYGSFLVEAFMPLACSVNLSALSIPSTGRSWLKHADIVGKYDVDIDFQYPLRVVPG